MRELPILFSGPMVVAIREGRKTQTRRVSDKPRYEVGDHLWVREAIERIPKMYDEVSGYHTEARYGADGQLVTGVSWVWQRPQLPGMFLPYALARTWLLVTGVRCERLRDITEADALAEGIQQWEGMFREYNKPDNNPGWTRNPICSFGTLWDSLNAKRGYSWESNPWCWCYSFERLAR